MGRRALQHCLMGVTRPGQHELSAATVACVRPAHNVASKRAATDRGEAVPRKAIVSASMLEERKPLSLVMMQPRVSYSCSSG